MDWRATVNLTIMASFIISICVCPSSVEGDASLLGIEHNFRVGQPTHSNNHHSHHDHHAVPPPHHDDNHVSSKQLDDDKDYNEVKYDTNEVEYDINDITKTSNDEYYDDNPDRSFKYEFEADGYRRSEESDSSGLVVGSYSYIDAAGKERSLSYRAGANIGFVPVKAEGLHPEILASFNDFGKRHSSTDSAIPLQVFSLNSRSTISSESRAMRNIKGTLSVPNHHQNSEYGNVRQRKPTNTYLPPSIDQKPKRKQTISVPSNNKYNAGAEKGFVIENEAELVGSVGKVTKEGSSSSSINGLGSSSSILDARQTHNAPSEIRQTNTLDSATINFVGSNIDQNTWESDGTYSFGYKSEDSKRNEIRDESGFVTGSYVMMDASGQPMTVRYRAGPEIGYVVENLDEVNTRSVPQIMEVGHGSNIVSASSQNDRRISRPYNSQHGSPLIGSGVLPPIASRTPTVQAPYSSPSITDETTSNNPEDRGNNDYDDYYDPDADRSYSFSYAEDRGVPGWISRRQEEADSNGQVKGRYSYVNDDGNEIAVQYSAGAGIGFVVENKDELKAQVRKATEDGALKLSKVRKVKIVKKMRNGSKVKENAGRRTVVRKGLRRISPKKPKGSDATPLSIVSKSSSSERRPAVTLPNKQVGEECGTCFSPDTNYFCGSCASGLECVKDSSNKLLPDASSRCKKKLVTSKSDNLPTTLYSLPRKPDPTPPSTLYGAPTRKPSPTPPATLYSAPEKSRTSSFESFPFLEVAKFVTPQGNLLDINENKNIDGDISYDYYNDEDYDENGDASFNFSFESDNLAHQETSDANGERYGSYKTIGQSGETIIVRYRAGVNGFEILNPEEVLPKAPAV